MKVYPKIPRYDHPVVPESFFDAEDLVVLEKFDGSSFRFTLYDERHASSYPDPVVDAADLKRKRRDFLHKLSNYYAREYDLVAVEDLDAKGLVELPGNSRNRAGAAWGMFLRMLESCK